MSLLHRVICLLVLGLAIFSYLAAPSAQALILESETEDLSLSTESTETVIEEVYEEASEVIEPITNETATVIQEVSEETSKVIEEVYDESLLIESSLIESTLIEPTVNLISNEMEAIIEELSEVVTEPVDTTAEQMMPASELNDSLGHLETELLQPEPKDETVLQPNLPDETSPLEPLPLSDNLTEANPGSAHQKEDPKAELVELDPEPEAVQLELDPEPEAAKTSSVPPSDPKPNKVPVPVGIMAAYTALPNQSKQGSQNGSHYITGSPDAALIDSIQIKLASKRHLVSLAKLYVSNRANEPPGQPPKHPLFSE